MPRGFAEDIDLCAVVATQRVPLTQENIDRLVNPYGELEQILSLLEALSADKSSWLSSGERDELSKLIRDLRKGLERSNNYLDRPTGTVGVELWQEMNEREWRRQECARSILEQNLDRINRFLNPDGWVSCPTTILNPDNRGALEGKADVGDFAGVLAIVVLPPGSSVTPVKDESLREGSADLPTLSI